MRNDSPKILLVEDEPDVCGVIYSYLGRRGYIVSATASGKEALSLIDISRPDILLLDFTLQDMNGKEVLSRLRGYDKTTKVVAITGELLKDEEIEKIKSLGISAYLQKPVFLEELEKIISDILGNKFDSRAAIKKAKGLSSNDADDSKRAVVHELMNLLGIIRNTCENFTLDANDGLYQDRSEKEIIDSALQAMNVVMKTVDRAAGAVEKIPQSP